MNNNKGVIKGCPDAPWVGNSMITGVWTGVNQYS